MLFFIWLNWILLLISSNREILKGEKSEFENKIIFVSCCKITREGAVKGRRKNKPKSCGHIRKCGGGGGFPMLSYKISNKIIRDGRRNGCRDGPHTTN